MNLTSRRAGPALVITVQEARIDAANAIRFRDAFWNESAGNGPRIILDMSQVDFVDSSGLGAIVAAMRRLDRYQSLELAGLTENVDRLFDLTRMDMVFTIHRDVETALAVHAD